MRPEGALGHARVLGQEVAVDVVGQFRVVVVQLLLFGQVAAGVVLARLEWEEKDNLKFTLHLSGNFKLVAFSTHQSPMQD